MALGAVTSSQMNWLLWRALGMQMLFPVKRFITRPYTA